MEAQSAISFQRVIITNSESYLQHLSPVIFYQENPVSKLIQGLEKANKSRCKNSLRDCFCDFSIKFARKRAHWERPCNALGMNALMFSAKCAFGIYVIWGTDCFEAYRQQPCLLGRESSQASQGGFSTLRGKAHKEQRGDECSAAWSISVLGISSYLFFFSHKYDGVNRAT